MGLTVTILAEPQSFASLEAVAAEIEKELGIKTLITLRSELEEATVKTMLATGDMADLFVYHSGAKLNDLNPSETIVDLSDEPYIGNFISEYFLSSNVKGKVYGVPVSSTLSYAWAYNKEVYRELSLDVPQTWKQLMDNCQVIQEAGITPVLGAFGSRWTSQVVLLSEAYNIFVAEPSFAKDLEAGLANFADTPAALRGFEKLAEIRQYLNPDYASIDTNEALRRLTTGSAAHFPMSSRHLNTIQSQYPEKSDQIGFFGQPGDDPENHGITIWMPYSLYIYKYSPNIELAKQWLSYLFSPQGYNALTSVNRPDGPYAIDGILLPDDVPQGILELQEYFDAGKTHVALEFETSLKGPNSSAICMDLIFGVNEPLEAAQAYDADLDKLRVLLLQ